MNDLETNEIRVNIRKARIVRAQFVFDKDQALPKISITVALETQSGKQITEVEFASWSWNDNTKLNVDDVPPFVFESLGDVVATLMPILVRKINGIEKSIAYQENGGKASVV